MQENPDVFISGGWDSVLYIWDIRDNKPVNYIYGPKIYADTIDEKDGCILTG